MGVVADWLGFAPSGVSDEFFELCCLACLRVVGLAGHPSAGLLRSSGFFENCIRERKKERRGRRCWLWTAWCDILFALGYVRELKPTQTRFVEMRADGMFAGWLGAILAGWFVVSEITLVDALRQ